MRTRLASLAALALAASGCADNTASVRVSMICAPPDDAAKCTFEATCGAEFIGPNTIDVTSPNRSLWLMVQVDNQLPNNRDEKIGRVNTNDAWIHEYRIEYEGLALPEGRGLIEGSAFVPANGSAVISVLAVNQTVFPGLVAGAQVLAHMRLRGVYGDTHEFETGPFDIPFHVCSGCIPAFTCTTGVPVACPQGGQLPASFACKT